MRATASQSRSDEMIRGTLIALSSTLTGLAILLGGCAALGIGMESATQAVAPRWCTGNVALLVASMAAFSWTVTVGMLRWPSWARIATSLVLLVACSYAGLMGLFWVFFVG